MKITSRSAAGAGTSKGSTTGAGTAGFEAAGAAQGGGGKAGSSWSAIANEASGGCSSQRNLNAPFTELRRTGQEAAKTEIFKARAAMHYARQHAGPAGRNLTDLILNLRTTSAQTSLGKSEPERTPWIDRGREGIRNCAQ